MHFLTVTHSPELVALRMQARSFARFVDVTAVDSIIVICNEPAMETFRARFDAEVRPEYGVHARKITLLHRDALARPLDWRHGWRSQQMLKLLGSRLVQDGVLLVLDSKNHFVHPITADSYRAPDGRLRSWQSHHRGHMEQFFRASVAVFGIPAEPHIDAWTPTVTPLPIPVADVRGCVDTLYEIFGPNFHDHFLHWECKMTEFFLVSAYQLRVHGNLSAVYDFKKPSSAILFIDKVTDKNRFDSVMFSAGGLDTLSFAIHHAAYAPLSDSQRARIADFWFCRGLISERDEAKIFLHSPYDE